jgi:hypothetical protein
MTLRVLSRNGGKFHQERVQADRELFPAVLDPDLYAGLFPFFPKGVIRQGAIGQRRSGIFFFGYFICMENLL